MRCIVGTLSGEYRKGFWDIEMMGTIFFSDHFYVSETEHSGGKVFTFLV